MNEVPVIQGLMLCEGAVTDARTRNLSLTNRFTIYRVDSFPTRPLRFSVFASLTNGFGEFRLRLDLQDLSTDDVLYNFQRTARFSDRLQDVPLLWNVSDLVFPKEGPYQVTLFVDDEPLSRYRFQILPRFRS